MVVAVTPQQAVKQLSPPQRKAICYNNLLGALPGEIQIWAHAKTLEVLEGMRLVEPGSSASPGWRKLTPIGLEVRALLKAK